MKHQSSVFISTSHTLDTQWCLLPMTGCSFAESMHTYRAKITWYDPEELNLDGWEGHRKTKSVKILLRAVKLFMPLSETEYNDDCWDQYNCSLQDTMMFANLAGYTKLISKSNCPVQLPRFLEFWGSIQRNAKWPEYFTAWGRVLVSQELEGTRSHGL